MRLRALLCAGRTLRGTPALLLLVLRPVLRGSLALLVAPRLLLRAPLLVKLRLARRTRRVVGRRALDHATRVALRLVLRRAPLGLLGLLRSLLRRTMPLIAIFDHAIPSYL
ncbi:MAG: hypothetical protein Q4C41_09890 [Eggerthellaceae bacterium]|nr:hypothetical protein [Eggerthellaceae bacterium]